MGGMVGASAPANRCRRIRLKAALPVILGIVLTAAFLATVYGSMRWAQYEALWSLRQTSAHRAHLYSATLIDVIKRFEYLPFVVANDPRIRRLLAATPADEAVVEINRWLEALAEESGALDVYVMDRDGNTVAASNWSRPRSFLGRNYAFRPYFLDAVRGRPGRFYGIGTTSIRPGYYLSYPVELAGSIRGVAAVKIDLEALEPSWQSDDAFTIVADENGVVFLTSIPDLRFKTLGPLDTSAQSVIRLTRQYHGVRLEAMHIESVPRLHPDVTVVTTRLGADADRRFLRYDLPLPLHDWRLVTFAATDVVASHARTVGLVAGLGYALVVLLALYWHQQRRRHRESRAAKRALERAHGQLEVKVARRTAELMAINRQLREEIAERRRTEAILRDTRDELVQAAKLALLGQLSASIAHEINQPLTALRTFSDNAAKLLELERTDELRRSLRMISDLTERVGSISAQLKNFSRRTPPRIESIDVRVAVENALMLTSQRMRQENIALTSSLPERPVFALCELIRLEQVLVNLLCNAADALRNAAERRIEIACRREGDEVLIEVIDSGSGIPEHIKERLFEPFVTTKESGLGLGLAISTAMVRAWNGQLIARDRPGRGSYFGVRLKSPRSK